MIRYLHMDFTGWCALILSACFVFPGGSASAQFRSYHIGNSLTWDGLGGQSGTFSGQGLEALVAHGGDSLLADYHIRNGSSLYTILNDPNFANELEGGLFKDALPNNEWDAVTLQPHISQSSTLIQDETSILSFIDLARTNPANSDTVFYVYQTWPRNDIYPDPNFPYQEFWESSSPDLDSTRTFMKAEYFENLMSRVTSQTDAIVRLIPVGEVFYELDKLLDTTGVPEISAIGDFYRDDKHLSADLGRFVASTTILATMFQQDPEGYTRPVGFYQNSSAFTQGYYEVIWDIVWDVVTRNKHTGIADFNNSGWTDSTDLALWGSAYASSSLGDSDGDGQSNGLDFLNWQLQTDNVFRPIADFNGDTLVDHSDLETWESCYTWCGHVDSDLDGLTTGLDFLTWQREYGMNTVPVTTNVGVVPEPNGIALALTTSLLSLLRRSRDS